MKSRKKLIIQTTIQTQKNKQKAVSFGFGDVNEMVSAGAKAVIDDIRQLPDVLSKLFD